MQQKRQDLRKAIEMELEQARYEARFGSSALRIRRSGTAVGGRRIGGSLEYGLAKNEGARKQIARV